jgi:uncharacterized protein (TIGR03435 family)
MGPAVANHLWQSTAFAVVVAGLALALKKNQARARYWVWMAASMKFLLPFALLAAIGSHLARPRALPAPAQQTMYFAVEDFSEPFVEMQGTGNRGEFSVVSSQSMEPGVFGVWRAALAWPAGISERLDDAHLEAIVAHEVCHVRRRDNLTAALHMLVEAAFWFHPLVWWLGARLIAERERACDEEVLRLGGRPQAYAEGILKVCEFCVESPLECVAGVTGADLKQRVVQIMTDGVARKLTLAKKLLLAAAALCAVAVPVLLGQAQAARRMMLAAVATAPKPVRAWAAAHAMIAEEQTPSSGLIAEAQAGAAPAGTANPTGDDKAVANGVPGDAATAGDGQKQVLQGVYKVWLAQDARWIITPEEQGAFLALTNDEERDKFIQQFWQRRNPTPNATGNAYRDEIYARIAYANENFASRQPGWSTDRGHVYIAYGKPDEIVVQPVDGPVTWLYRHIPGVGDNVVLKFVKPSGDNDYRLETPWPGSGTGAQAPDPLRPNPLKRRLSDLAFTGGSLGAGAGAASAMPPAQAQERAAAEKPSAAAYVPTMTFDVASIRETKPGPEMHFVGGRFTPHTTDLKLENVTLYWLLSIAYGVDDHQISGQPDWTGRTTFNVEAKSDAAADQRMATLDKEQENLEQQHMMQALLAERFNLKVHWATQEGSIYNLVLAKSGSKLRPAGSMPPPPEELKWLGDSKTPPPIHQQGDGRLGYEFYGHDCPIEDLAHMIGSMMGRDVVNQTGLTGKFDFHIQYHGNTPRDNRNEEPTVWPPLTDALEDQLGLKLEAGKGPVRLLVVDHVEMPSAN